MGALLARASPPRQRSAAGEHLLHQGARLGEIHPPGESLADFLARLAVASLIGMLIGLERQLSGRPAGLHTTGLVAAGAALFATIEPAATGSSSYRIISNIVTGVGFLAGGVILRQGDSVSGLNTAATIWATAAVGVLAGLALFREAAIGALAIIGLNLLVGIGSRINVRRQRD